MIWRTCGSLSRSSARSAYSTLAVGFIDPEATRPRYCGVSASSRSSRRPRASLVAVPRDGIRSPRIRREMVEWSTPDCCASWRCDIFLALSWARSHSLKARPFCVVMSRWALRRDRPSFADRPASDPHYRMGPRAPVSPVGTDELDPRTATRPDGAVGSGGVRGGGGRSDDWYFRPGPDHGRTRSGRQTWAPITCATVSPGCRIGSRPSGFFENRYLIKATATTEKTL